MPVLTMLIWGVAIAVVLGIGYGAVSWMRKRDREDVLKEVKQQFDGVPILALAPDACFNGLDRSWDSQWRGCGVLILTGDLLYFRSWQRTLDLTIPLSRMEEVGVDLDLEKKGQNQSRFQVSYRGMDDQVRMATWLVSQPQQWVNLVHRML